MAKKLAYERYCWLHKQVNDGKHPNARKLAERFEISIKQAQRDITFIRDRMGAPLSYNRYRKGYEYDSAGFELPPLWFGQDGLLALCLALRLAATLPDRGLKKSLHQALEKFNSYQFSDSPPDLEDIKRKVSVKNIQYYRVKETTFHSVINALFKNSPLSILYYSPHKNETTERVVFPLHLLCYMGSWHLITFCTLRKGLRDFALSRIKAIEPYPSAIRLPYNLPPMKEYIRKKFGLITGEEFIEVCLRFTPKVSKWIAEQVWHTDQQISFNSDGGMNLRFTVADFKEVSREILKHGSNVEVLSPLKLRKEIKKEIIKMKEIYS